MAQNDGGWTRTEHGGRDDQGHGEDNKVRAPTQLRSCWGASSSCPAGQSCYCACDLECSSVIGKIDILKYVEKCTKTNTFSVFLETPAKIFFFVKNVIFDPGI